jgi:hypothetical protein
MSHKEHSSNWFWGLLCCLFTLSFLSLESSCLITLTRCKVEWDQIMSPFKVDLCNLELTPVFGQFNHTHEHQHHVVWY